MPNKGETWIFKYVGSKGAHTVKVIACVDDKIIYRYKDTPPSYKDRSAPVKTFIDMYKKHELGDISSYPPLYDE